MQPLNVYSLISTVNNVVCDFIFNFVSALTQENSGHNSCVVNKIGKLHLCIMYMSSLPSFFQSVKQWNWD